MKDLPDIKDIGDPPDIEEILAKYRQEKKSRPNRVVTGRLRTVVIILQTIIYGVTRYWLWAANLFALFILGLGILAPFSMANGQVERAQSAYNFLATQNHQRPERSYFLFSDAGGIQTYSIEQLETFGVDPAHSQSFIGTPELGYKMGLNHRMTAIFIAILLAGLAWPWMGYRPQLSWIWFLFFLLPLVFDGLAHGISESSTDPFRETNAWAVALTGGLFSNTFYTGTTYGTLNWLLRTVTGFWFGLGLVWFLYAYLLNRFAPVRNKLAPKLRKIGVVR
ncbi:MAG: DUF2085 domain-containing protein [Chloroflexota bacterium]